MMIAAVILGIALFAVAAILHLRTLDVALSHMPSSGRIGSGVLTGFLLISASASYVFRLVRRDK